MSKTYEQVIEDIKNNKNINFVAFARTPWHAHGVQVALSKLNSDKNVQLNGLIFTTENNGDTIINSDSFSKVENVVFTVESICDATYSHSKLKNLIERINQINYCKNHKKGGRTIYVINPMQPNYTFILRLYKSVPNINIVNVICDEGIGTYMRTKRNWYVESTNNISNPISKIRIYIETIFTCPHMMKNLTKKGECLDYQVLKQIDKMVFVPNDNIVSFYKNNLLNDFQKKDNNKYDYYSNSVVINTQLYYENKQIKNDFDLELYKYIIDSLKGKGINVIIKPHPREKNVSRYSSLNCTIEKDNTQSQESIFASLNKKPLCVISFSSTSLVTSKLFYDITAISLNKLCDNATTKGLKNELNNFNKVFQNVILLPATKEELINLIIKN